MITSSASSKIALQLDFSGRDWHDKSAETQFACLSTPSASGVHIRCSSKPVGHHIINKLLCWCFQWQGIVDAQSVVLGNLDVTAPNYWNLVAKHVKGKTGLQCYNYHMSALGPTPAPKPKTKPRIHKTSVTASQDGKQFSIITAHDIVSWVYSPSPQFSLNIEWRNRMSASSY